MSVGRVAADERGPRPTLDDIEIGKTFGPVEWSVAERDIDGCCMAQDDYHEWYSIDSPFGGRVAPPTITYIVPRETFKKVYRVRGLFVGWTSEQLDVIRPNVTYTWTGKISDKYVRRNREWVWYDFTLCDPQGKEIIRTKRGHVLDFLTIDAPKTVVSVGGFSAGNDLTSNTNIATYFPPVVAPKSSSALERPPDAPVWNVRNCDKDTPIGSRIVPVSQQCSLRFCQDYYELYTALAMPSQFRARHIHNDPEIAKQEGLDAPNIPAPQAAGSTIARMMLAALGEGWLKGSRFELRFIKQIMLDDFVTSKGVLIGKHLEGDRLRLDFDVWIENQRGEKVCVGRVSGPVPA